MARAPKTFRARFELPAELEHYVDPSDDTDMDDSEAMTEEQLAALVDDQINDATLYDSSDLIQSREKALKFFEGEVDITPAPGRSQVVSRDVADTHGLIMPGLMRVFLATDNIAIYNPATPKDEPFARQATDYVNYIVMKECQGYIQFRSAFHNGLLLGNGPIKHWWDDTPQYSTDTFSGLSSDAYTELVMDPDVDILERDEYPDPDWVPPPPMPAAPMALPPMLGPGMAQPPPPPQAMPTGDPLTEMPPEEPQAPVLYDCKIKRMTSKGRLRMMALAPEDLLLGRGTLALDEEHIRFVGHRWQKTRSQLIKEGFDEDQVNDLPAYTGQALDTPEALARDRRNLFGGDNPPDKSTELIEGYECYTQCDFDGDGVAEWRKVTVAGTSGKRALLENEEWGDDLPFSDIVPDPVPHRWRGRSLYDLVGDIQRRKTALMRATYDNIYMTVNPRQYSIENSIVNPEVLQDWEIGSHIIERQPNSVRFDAMPFIAKEAFGVLEYEDQVSEKRTGVSRSTVALDMDALQDQTATAVNAQQAASHTKVEEYARNIAEHGGLQRVFSKILKLIVKHQDRSRTVRLRDEWVEVDPRAWNANMDVTINTGLGSGSRERDLTMLMGVAAKQEAIIMQLGPTNPALGLDKLFATYRKMAEAAGIKSPEQFFPEIPPEVMKQMQQAAAQKVDPKLQAAQLQAQTDKQKAQMQAQVDAQADQTRAGLEARKMQMQFGQQAQLAQMQARMDQQSQQFEQQLKTMEAQRAAQLQQIQFERQAQVEERQAQADIAVKNRDAQMKAQLEHMKFQAQTQMAQMQFEFDKKLKLLDLYVKSKIAAAKPAPGADGKPAQPAQDVDIDLDEMLANAGADFPGSEEPSQIAQALTGLGEHMSLLSQAHSDSSNSVAAALAELAKPKRERVVRRNGQVVGREFVPDGEDY